MSDETTKLAPPAAPVAVAEPPAPAPPPTLADGTPDDDAQNNLVQRDKNGDPLPDPKAVAMRERESYERVVEGLAKAADRAKHCARREPNRLAMWMGIAQILDQVRRIAVQLAGIEHTIKLKETGDVRGDAMQWIDARKEFTEALKQAAGGCRQLAVVHRSEPMWLKLARQIEQLGDKAKRPPLLHPACDVPTGYIPRPGLLH